MDYLIFWVRVEGLSNFQKKKKSSHRKSSKEIIHAQPLDGKKEFMRKKSPTPDP